MLKFRMDIKYAVAAIITVLALVIALPIGNVFADEKDGNVEYHNPETGFDAIIIDDANLLQPDQYDKLLEDMKPITEYGNAVFYSTSEYQGPVTSVSESKYQSTCGLESGTLFIIDMNQREMYIYSMDDVYKIVNKSYANTITDNNYKYATNGDYYKCASETFKQMYTILDGGKISQPMKYVSNILLAIILAILINYAVVRMVSNTRDPSNSEVLKAIVTKQASSSIATSFSHQTRVYDPPSSSSSGGGGGGGGGGGHSGGGGGHSF